MRLGVTPLFGGGGGRGEWCAHFVPMIKFSLPTLAEWFYFTAHLKGFFWPTTLALLISGNHNNTLKYENNIIKNGRACTSLTADKHYILTTNFEKQTKRE